MSYDSQELRGFSPLFLKLSGTNMASRVKSGVNGNLDGYQEPRRSGRSRKPRVNSDYVNYNTPSPRLRGSKSARTKDGGGPRTQQPRPTSGRPKPNQRNRGQATTREDSDIDTDYSEDYDTSDTLDNLEERVDDLRHETWKKMSDFENIVKLIFDALPQEIIENLRNMARSGDEKGIIDYYLVVEMVVQIVIYKIGTLGLDLATPA